MARPFRPLTVSAALAATLFVSVVYARLGAGAAPPAVEQEQDLGPTAAAQTVTASLVLKVRHPEALEAFVALTQIPNAADISSVSVAQRIRRAVRAELGRHRGDHAIPQSVRHHGRPTSTRTICSSRRPAPRTRSTRRSPSISMILRKGEKHFHRPRHAPRIPLLLRDLLVAVEGPSTESRFRPMHVRAAQTPDCAAPAPTLPTGGVIATGVPGDYTVGDVANLYNINPLYAAHIDGTGRTRRHRDARQLPSRRRLHLLASDRAQRRSGPDHAGARRRRRRAERGCRLGRDLARRRAVGRPGAGREDHRLRRAQHRRRLHRSVLQGGVRQPGRQPVGELGSSRGVLLRGGHRHRRHRRSCWRFIRRSSSRRRRASRSSRRRATTAPTTSTRPSTIRSRTSSPSTCRRPTRRSPLRAAPRRR